MPFCRQAVVFSLTACADPTPVRVSALLASGVPLRQFEIVALPFDPQGLLDSLAAAAPRPRPAFPELERRLAEYRPVVRDTVPDPRGLAAMLVAEATRDSVLRLSAALRRMDRTEPGYREAYNRFRDLYARYSSREAARETATRRADAADRRLADQASRAADSVRMWERVAYRDFPRLAQERAAATGRAPQRFSTDSAGRAALHLSAGDWWLSARLPDPANPFLEHYWNVAFRAAGWPFGVPLSPANAGTRWRH